MSENYPDPPRRTVLAVVCPHCGAGQQEKCISRTGRPTYDAHSARFAMAKRAGVFDDPEGERLARMEGSVMAANQPVPLRRQILDYLAAHPRATTAQISEALGRGPHMDELDAMADDGLLTIHNVGGYIGWEIR